MFGISKGNVYFIITVACFIKDFYMHMHILFVFFLQRCVFVRNITSALHRETGEKEIELTPRHESSRVFRLSVRFVEPSPKDVQEVDHRVESLLEVSPGVRDTGTSRIRLLDDIVTSLKQGLSKA